MSVRTLPLVFINLGGEMLYILDQRLRSLNTSEDNSEKVMNDIVGTLFNRAFMDELLKPQHLYSHRTMKTVLTRIAHASIMRLNAASMDRLYELMVMAFKYQVLLCPRPKDMLLITYNHMDAIREFVQDTPVIVNQVDETHRKIIEVYSSFTEGEFQLLRQTLLIFFQDMHVRVSLFLKNKTQNPNGRFALTTSGPVPHGSDVPGLIRLFDCKGREVRRHGFPVAGSYSSSIRPGSFGLQGPRVIRLGLNMYTMSDTEETHTSNTPSVKVNMGLSPNLLAKEELNLLARLMGSMRAEDRVEDEAGTFRVHLFYTDEEEDEEEATGMFVCLFVCLLCITICWTQDEHVTSELALIAGQFTEAEENSGNHSDNREDLLAMMDDL
uniref:Protein OSCP1-like n=1 Tax=Gouania willdenowi TaxID=441366 RepID=A0A8C5DMP2_GOUWI